MYYKIITLIACIVATSTIFWANNAGTRSGQEDQSQAEAQDHSASTQRMPQGPALISEENLIIADMDRATDSVNSVKFRKKFRMLKRETDGDLQPIVDFIQEQLKERHGPMTRGVMKHTLRNVLLEMPGDIPNKHIRSFAELNKTCPEVINEMVWKFVVRTESGETIPERTLDELIYAIDIAATSAPQDWHVFDTKSHLHKLAGDLDAAIQAANKAVDLCPTESKADFQKHLEELQQQRTQSSENVTE